MSLITYFGEISDLLSRNPIEDSDDEAEQKEAESLADTSSKLESRVSVNPPNFQLPNEVTKIIVSITDFNHSIASSQLRDTVNHLAALTPNPKAFGKSENDSSAVKGIKVSVVQSKIDPTTAWITFNKLPHVTSKSGRLVAVVHEILTLILSSQVSSSEIKTQFIVISHEKLQGGVHQQTHLPFVYLINEPFNLPTICKSESFKKHKLLPPGVITSPVPAYAFQFATLRSHPAIALVITESEELVLQQPVGSSLCALQSLIPSDLRTLIHKGSVYLSSHLETGIFT